MGGSVQPQRCSPQESVPRLDLLEIFRKIRDQQAARGATAARVPRIRKRRKLGGGLKGGAGSSSASKPRKGPGSTRDVVSSKKEAPGSGDKSYITDGLQITGWSVSTHGKTILVVSKDTVPETAQHIIGIVDKFGNRPITIFSGVHGGKDGSVTPETDFYERDKAQFGKRPNVTVIDASGMTAEQLSARALKTPGVVIVNTCNGEACVK